MPVVGRGISVRAQDDQLRYSRSHRLAHHCIGLAPEASHERLDNCVQLGWHMPKLRRNRSRLLRKVGQHVPESTCKFSFCKQNDNVFRLVSICNF